MQSAQLYFRFPCAHRLLFPIPHHPPSLQRSLPQGNTLTSSPSALGNVPRLPLIFGFLHFRVCKSASNVQQKLLFPVARSLNPYSGARANHTPQARASALARSRRELRRARSRRRVGTPRRWRRTPSPRTRHSAPSGAANPSPTNRSISTRARSRALAPSLRTPRGMFHTREESTTRCAPRDTKS